MVPSHGQRLTGARPSDVRIRAEFTMREQDHLLQEVVDSTTQRTPAMPARPSQQWSPRRKAGWLAVAAGVIALAVLTFSLLPGRGSPTATSTVTARNPTAGVSVPVGTALPTVTLPHATLPAGLTGLDLLGVAAEIVGRRPSVNVGINQYLHRVLVHDATDEPAVTDEYVALDWWSWRRHETSTRVIWESDFASSFHVANTIHATDPQELDRQLRTFDPSNVAVFLGLGELLQNPLLSSAEQRSALLALQNLARNPKAVVLPNGKGEPSSPPTIFAATATVRIKHWTTANGSWLFAASITGPSVVPSSFLIRVDGSNVSTGPVTDGSSEDLAWVPGVALTEVVDLVPPDFLAVLGTARDPRYVTQGRS